MYHVIFHPEIEKNIGNDNKLYYKYGCASKLDINQNVIFTIHYLLSDGLLLPQYSGKVRLYKSV